MPTVGHTRGDNPGKGVGAQSVPFEGQEQLLALNCGWQTGSNVILEKHHHLIQLVTHSNITCTLIPRSLMVGDRDHVVLASGEKLSLLQP